MSIQPAGTDLSVALTTTKTRKQNKPASLQNKSVMKKEFHKMAKAVVNQVCDYWHLKVFSLSSVAVNVTVVDLFKHYMVSGKSVVV